MSILVVGSVAYDTIKTPFGKVDRALGGSATHFSLAATVLNKDMNLVGVVGNDFNDQDIDFLKKRGVNFDALIRKEDGKTFFWEGYYEYDMNQAHTVTTELNVFQDFDPVIPEEMKDIDYLFLANIDPDIQIKVIEQMKSPKLIVCDTMNFWIENKRDRLIEVLKKSDVVLLNDGEARELFNTPVLMKAAYKALDLGVDTVVIKKGEHGSLLIRKDSFFAAPAYPLEEIIDPTGAGDSFAGGFVSYLEKKDKITDIFLRQAVVYATVVASFNVEDFGTKGLRDVTFKDIEERYKELYRITKFEELL